MKNSEEYLNVCLNQVEQYGKTAISSNFKISDQDYNVIASLIAYFTFDEKLAQQFNICLTKGIMLNGPVGSGKTSLMKIMARYALPHLKFKMLNSRILSMHFSANGVSEVLKYTSTELIDKSVPGLCIDELGLETSFGHYGSTCNVIAETILGRYELFMNYQFRTHLITNLNIDELEQIYGSRVRSRLREMINLISFSPDTKDKRI